jgi:hypothetical protein
VIAAARRPIPIASKSASQLIATVYLVPADDRPPSAAGLDGNVAGIDSPPAGRPSAGRPSAALRASRRAARRSSQRTSGVAVIPWSTMLVATQVIARSTIDAALPLSAPSLAAHAR